MDPGLDPSGRLEGPIIQTYTRALLEEPLRIRRTTLLKDNSRAEKGDGRIMIRPARVWIRNH